MRITVSNQSEEPIYQQIAAQIQEAILRGELAAGAALPSIRGLARELRISVITTKRAYEELEAKGFLDSVPGKGVFVAAQSQALLREERLKRVEEALEAALDTARALGISQAETQEIFRLLCGGES